MRLQLRRQMDQCIFVNTDWQVTCAFWTLEYCHGMGAGRLSHAVSKRAAKNMNGVINELIKLLGTESIKYSSDTDFKVHVSSNSSMNRVIT